MNGHGAGVAIKSVAPDLIQQLIPRKNLAGMTGEEPEQIELLGGQIHHLIV